MAGPRVRFAPSPTGLFHVGSARTALYNWLVARQGGGTFVLRIEDTDTERNEERWVDGILDSLRWLGLDWDELYRQSERSQLYAAAAERLAAQGDAYWCDCTRDQVDERTRGNATPGYDRHCRDRQLEPAPGRALRFRVPLEGSTVVVDAVRGEPTFEHHTIEDFVLQRSNGTPVFILANVVDDVDMAITHVIRGEEHLPNTPKYLLLWRALGGGVEPVFAHLPVIVNERRQKLSKRRPEDRVNLQDYIDEGYITEAVVNYLALVGWAPGGDREMLSIDEMVTEFSLGHVSPSPGFFDQRKLLHFNDEWLRRLSVDEFIARCAPFLERGPWAADRFDSGLFATMAPLVQERAKVLGAVSEFVDFLFLDEAPIVDKDWDKAVVRGPSARAMLEGAQAAYATCDWDGPALHAITESLGEQHGLKLGKAQAPIRVAVCGRSIGPPLFESLAVLGRERTLERLAAALARLGASS